MVSSAGPSPSTLLEMGDYGAAMEAAQRVLQEEPGQLDATLVLADLALEAGNRELAARLIGTGRRAAPSDPRVVALIQEMNRPTRMAKLPARLLALATSAFDAGDFARAVHVSRAALSKAPSLAGAHALLGRALLGLGQPAEAVPVLREAANRAPNDAQIAAVLTEAEAQAARLASAPAAIQEQPAERNPRPAATPSPGSIANPTAPAGFTLGARAGRNTRELALPPIQPKTLRTKPVGRKICITFGGEVYDGSTAMTVMLAPKFGADEVWVYDDNWIVNQRPDFYEHNRWLWEHHHKRGFGWYAWKPFILLDAMERMNDGDVVLYIDADTFPVDDFTVLYEICSRDGGIMLFKAGGNVNQRFRQSQWCKRDCFVVMNQDAEPYYSAEAGVARFMLFQKGQWRAHQFLMEWLTYCVNPLATTFDPSVLGAPEIPDFVEHRTEQAIMTNLGHKYGLKLYREACELGNSFPEDKDLYPQLFSQLNPWGNKTAPCVGSKFRNVS